MTVLAAQATAQCATGAGGGGWVNTPFAAQAGTFTATFDATPSASPSNSVVALSNGAHTAYTGFASLIGFNTAGTLNARNGGAYAADTTIHYSAGVTYHFRLVVNVGTHTYSIFVTPAGGAEQTLGNNFAFRTEQNTVTRLNNYGIFVAAASGTVAVCNFTVSPSNPQPDFSIAATPSSQTVTAGNTTSYTAEVSAISGFSGTVALSASGLPAGATASFSPASVSGSGTATLMMTTAGSTPPGNSNIVITGVSGSLTHTASVILSVTPPAQPDFSIAATPSSQTVTAGSSAGYTLHISAIDGFNSNITLSATGLPAGATASFNPASVTGQGTSALAIATAGSTPNGSSTVTVTATGGGIVHSTTVMLVVGTDPVTRARQLVNRMTLSEKITEMHGGSVQRSVDGVSRLGIPQFNISNGPAGLTHGGPGHQGPATALPAAIALAATWDTSLAHLYGTILGAEAKDLANALLEGPNLNISRVPQNGRNFEALGEDPYLVSQIVVSDCLGIQSQGVIAEPKHYAANNQETNRTTINEIIDERTLREIYLPGFEATVKQAHAGAFMCAYNRVNGTFMCENGILQNQILKQEWGFDGFIISDFGATHSTVASANNGLDLEMPSGKFFGSALQNAVNAGQVSMATLDDHLVRRFSTMMRLGVFDHPPGNTPIPAQQDGAIARQIAEAGTVLLQNNGGLLPLNAATLHSIALIGPGATAAKTGGGGSSSVAPLYTVSPLTGLRNRVGAGVTVNLNDGSNISSAVSLARSADVAIVMVADSEAEGSDHSISLSGNQDQLVQSVAAANPRTVVVVKSGSAVLMPWVHSVPAIVEAWYPGEEDGNAVAAVLFGDVNPSGKLPMSFPAALADLPTNTAAQWPGVNGVAHYSEGVFMGYRHYDAHNIQPLFAFGHGLSYTSFSYQNLAIAPASFSFNGNPNQTVTVDFDVTNMGTRLGAEVAELYVGIPSTAVPEPPKWLKGFQKILLTPGQTGHVQLQLDERSFAYWDVTSHSWKVAPGTYQIIVGASSRDIRLQGQVMIN
ncbi:MAG TPA: glycoside hydrolase family 3 C-terminal domain-containing protein [Terriglobales bacterium]|nr:glycoside hydrolase family 3 C-terminal domain-containing protein [Terriglobales bacterium]